MLNQRFIVGNCSGYVLNPNCQEFIIPTRVIIPNKVYAPVNNTFTPFSFDLPSVKAKVQEHQLIRVQEKYWRKRFQLFSKFSLGVQMDEESFYSVCPEVLARHIATVCKHFDVALDPFCGAGGNAIQLAFKCRQVIAMDVDPRKIEQAKHNARIYGVAHKIRFVVGNFFTDAVKYRADVIVTSPPWGGPKYAARKVYALTDMCADNGGCDAILRQCQAIAPRLALHIPRNTSKAECMRLGKYHGGKVTVHECTLDGRLNSITAFIGDFKNRVQADLGAIQPVHLKSIPQWPAPCKPNFGSFSYSVCSRQQQQQLATQPRQPYQQCLPPQQYQPLQQYQHHQPLQQHRRAQQLQRA